MTQYGRVYTASDWNCIAIHYRRRLRLNFLCEALYRNDFSPPEKQSDPVGIQSVNLVLDI